MTDVIWSPQSLRDLDAIRAYIVQDSSLYADLVLGRIITAVERLRTFPESGRIVPERNAPRVREVIVRPYRVVYRLSDSVVEIVTVFRASRAFPALDES